MLASGSSDPGEFVISGSVDTAGHGKDDRIKGYYYPTI